MPCCLQKLHPRSSQVAGGASPPHLAPCSPLSRLPADMLGRPRCQRQPCIGLRQQQPHVSPGSGLCQLLCSCSVAAEQGSRPCSLCLNANAVYWEFSSTPQAGTFQEVCLPQLSAAPRGCGLLQKFMCRKVQDSPHQSNLKQVVFETPVLTWPEEWDLAPVSELIAVRRMVHGAYLSSGGSWEGQSWPAEAGWYLLSLRVSLAGLSTAMSLSPCRMGTPPCTLLPSRTRWKWPAACCSMGPLQMLNLCRESLPCTWLPRRDMQTWWHYFSPNKPMAT